MQAKRTTRILAATAVTATATVWYLLFNATPSGSGSGPRSSVARAAAPAPPLGSADTQQNLSSPEVRFEPSEPPLARSEITSAWADLLGATALSEFLVMDDLPRRIAATVDNLGRDHAPSMVWPVNPTPGRFQVSSAESASAEHNERRYEPFVRLVEQLDTTQAVRLYRRMYPLLNGASTNSRLSAG